MTPRVIPPRPKPSTRAQASTEQGEEVVEVVPDDEKDKGTEPPPPPPPPKEQLAPKPKARPKPATLYFFSCGLEEMKQRKTVTPTLNELLLFFFDVPPFRIVY